MLRLLGTLRLLGIPVADQLGLTPGIGATRVRRERGRVSALLPGGEITPFVLRGDGRRRIDWRADRG
jgi:hypothetical protein